MSDLYEAIDYQLLAFELELAIEAVANQTKRAKPSALRFRAILNDHIQFASAPIGWHLQEIAARVLRETDAASSFSDQYQPIRLLTSVDDCTRSTFPAEHANSAILHYLFSKLVRFGNTVETKTAAKQLLSHCPVTWPTPDTPFVDDAPCHCVNCRTVNDS